MVQSRVRCATVPTVFLAQPVSRYDLKAAILYCVEFSFEATYLDILHKLKKQYGAHPYLQYKIARFLHEAKLKKAIRLKKQKDHELRQQAWWDGERVAHYLKKHGCFGGSHPFLLNGLYEETGCEASLVDDESWDEGVPEEIDVPVKAQIKSVCKHCRLRSCGEFCDWLCRPLDDIKDVFVPPRRSIMLLTKLRAYIRQLRTCPMRVFNTPVKGVSKSKEWTSVVPQMDGKDGEELNTICTSNVVLTEENADSTAVAASNRFSFGWHQLCTTEKPKSDPRLLDRWTLVRTTLWKKQDMPTDYEFKDCKLDLPYDALMKTDGTMPLAINFKIYKYCKTDIEVKIHVNSNKFQVGQLMCSWQYMEKFDGNPLTSVFSRCQLPHVLINAGASNEATLIIPFKFIQPYLHTSQRKGSIDCLYIGSFKMHVVVPLAVGDSGPDSCGISIYVRFPNAEFIGMRDGSIGEPQMEGAAAAMVAGAVYNKFIGDKNCDNPSANANPSYLVPTGTHSWCVGTGVTEHLQSLRLDGTTRGVGREGIDDSETSIGIPCRTFGMLNHIEWSATDAKKNISGAVLWQADVHAQISKTLVKEIAGVDMKSYCMPPVSVVSSLYKYWRGSLEFKFDIIASQFHTGRLLCAYIPGAYGEVAIDMWQARNCPCIEFSLQDATSFTFVVPYISNSPWWPRRYTGPHKYAEMACPSKIVMYVLNPLVPMASIINSITIVPYMRAGADFEVAVPVQPSVGLSDCTTNNRPRQDIIYPTEGSYPCRATNYKGFGGDKKYIFYEGTPMFGTASTFHAPEKKLSTNEYYYGKFELPHKVGSFVYKLPNSTESKNDYIGYIVLWGTPNGNYGIPFPDTSAGEQLADNVAKMLKQRKPKDTILAYCLDYVSDSIVVGTDFKTWLAKPVYKVINDAPVGAGLPQMDNRYSTENNLMPTDPLPSTSNGSYMFNEKFTDLKDLARRYQIYCDETITLQKGYKSGGTLAVLPVIPHGLDLDIDNSDSIFNVCRDGHIPVISSGYIYFRGSLRFKFVFSSDSLAISGAKIWIQHHPDSDSDSRKCEIYPNIYLEDGFKSHGYSYYIQNASVNSIIEIEVPFYQPGMYGLTRKMSKVYNSRDLSQYYSLGSLVLGMNVGILEKAADISMQVYYSIGDDFSFNVFRGFPPVVFTDEVWPAREPGGNKKGIMWITGEPEMDEAQPEMMAAVKNFFIKPALNSVTEQVKEAVTEKVQTEVKKLEDSYKLTMKKKGLPCGIDHQVLTNALGNFFHVLANPQPKTIAIAVANVVVSLLAKGIINLIKMIDAVTAVISDHWVLFSGVTSAVPQSDSTGNSVHSLCGLLFTSVCMMAGIACAPPGKFPNILRDISSGVSLCTNSIRLIQNCSDLIVYSIKYVTAFLNPQYALEIKLADQVPDIKQWYEECMYLLEVRNRNKYLYDKSILSRVFDATVLGSILISNGIDDRSRAGKLIYDTHKEMRKLQSDLFERGVHPDVRFETYPIWLSGGPGIGKSFLVPKIINDLLRAANIAAPGSLIYNIPSGAKYWDGCVNPAALVSDDIFQVQGTKLEEEIAQVFHICSSAVLNPPMASIEEKNKRINPFIYVMLCNRDFPNISPTCSYPEAVYRRRKFLINADLDPACLENLGKPFKDASDLPRELTQRMGHLRFKIAENVRDPGTGYSDWMTYDTLLEMIKKDFLTHVQNERLNFIQRMRNMYSLDPNYDERNLVDAFPELEDKASLKEQMDIVKEHIQDELDKLEDPAIPSGIKGWIHDLKNRWSAVKALPEMDSGTECEVADGVATFKKRVDLDTASGSDDVDMDNLVAEAKAGMALIADLKYDENGMLIVKPELKGKTTAELLKISDFVKDNPIASTSAKEEPGVTITKKVGLSKEESADIKWRLQSGAMYAELGLSGINKADRKKYAEQCHKDSVILEIILKEKYPNHISYFQHTGNALDPYVEPSPLDMEIIKTLDSIAEEPTEEMVARFFDKVKPLDIAKLVVVNNIDAHFPDFWKFLSDSITIDKYFLQVGQKQEDIIKLLPMFCGGFNCTEIGDLYGNIGIIINTSLGIDKLVYDNVDTWYTKALTELFDAGSFDVFEQIRFACCLPGGVARCVSKIFNLSIVDKDFMDFDTSLEVSNNSALTQRDQINYNNVLKKQALRRSLEKLNLSGSSVIRRHFIVTAINSYIHTNLQHIKLQSLEKNLKVTGDMAKIVDSASFCLFWTQLAIDKKEFTDREFDKMIEFTIFAYAAIRIGEFLFGPTADFHGNCTAQNLFQQICKHPTMASFCSVRRKLQYCRTSVTPCKNSAHCIYSNDLMYYFIAMSTVGCGKFSECVSDPFGRTSIVVTEFDDLYRALRHRRSKLSQGIFSQFGRYCKHWFFHVLPEIFSGIYNVLMHQLPKILIVLGLSIVTGGVARYCFGGTNSVDIEPEGNYFKFDAVKHPKVHKPSIAHKNFVRPQMSPEQRLAMSHIVERNSVLLHVTYVKDGARMNRINRCLMLRGRAMLILRHYVEEFNYISQVENIPIECALLFGKSRKAARKLQEIEKTNNASEGVDNKLITRISINWSEITSRIAWCSSTETKLTSNFGIALLPNYVLQFKDIVSRIATKAEHNNAPSFADLYVVNGESSFNMAISVKKNFRVIETRSTSEVWMDCTYAYNRQYPGLCGSVLVAPTLGSGSGAIIGMHVAGDKSSGWGYSEPIYREMFLEFFNEFPQTQVMDPPLEEDFTPSFELDSNLLMYGCVPKNFAHKESGKSKIVPSLLHGVIYDVKTQPNPLKPGDSRQPAGSHPLRDGCEKHGTGDVKVFDQALVEEVKEDLVDRFQQIVRPVRAVVRPLTMQQSVCGDVNVPYFEALNWKSSEGFPLSTHRPKSAHDKRWLFDLAEGEEGYVLNKINPLLKQQLVLRDICFEKGIKPPTVYIDCLKDYRLSEEKCKIPGKTRIFSIAPIQCSIDIRMYMNDFCAGLKNSRIDNSIGIGINPDSLEWSKLVNYLFEVGNNIVTLDYSNFGPCLMSQLVSAGNEVIVNWFKFHQVEESHLKRVEWLLDNDILNPVHLADNLVYQTVNGISSGSPLTGECNSIPNLFYIRLTFLEIMRDYFPDYASMYYFNCFVRIVVYGDDLIMSIDNSIIEFFNALTIRDYLARHGIKVTSAQKDQEMVPYTTIYEATFLKRSFVEHPFRKGVWLAPIEKQSIEECLNWCHDSDNIQEATLECCRASLDLAYSQGPTYYKGHYDKIKKKLYELNIKIDFKSWFIRDNEIFGVEKEFNPKSISIDLPWYYAKDNVNKN